MLDLPQQVMEFSSSVQRRWKAIFSDVLERTNDEKRALISANSILHPEFAASLDNEYVSEMLIESEQFSAIEDSGDYVIHISLGAFDSYNSDKLKKERGEYFTEDVIREGLSEENTIGISIHDIHNSTSNNDVVGVVEWVGINEGFKRGEAVIRVWGQNLKRIYKEGLEVNYSIEFLRGSINDGKIDWYFEREKDGLRKYTKLRLKCIAAMEKSISTPQIPDANTLNVSIPESYSNDGMVPPEAEKTPTLNNSGNNGEGEPDEFHHSQAREPSKEDFEMTEENKAMAELGSKTESLQNEADELKAKFEAQETKLAVMERTEEYSREIDIHALELRNAGIVDDGKFEAFKGILKTLTESYDAKITDLTTLNEELQTTLKSHGYAMTPRSPEVPKVTEDDGAPKLTVFNGLPIGEYGTLFNEGMSEEEAWGAYAAFNSMSVEDAKKTAGVQ